MILYNNNKKLREINIQNAMHFKSTWSTLKRTYAI